MFKIFKCLFFRLFYRKRFLSEYKKLCYIQEYLDKTERTFPCYSPIKINDTFFPCGDCYLCKQAEKVLSIFKGVDNGK